MKVTLLLLLTFYALLPVYAQQKADTTHAGTHIFQKPAGSAKNKNDTAYLMRGPDACTVLDSIVSAITQMPFATSDKSKKMSETQAAGDSSASKPAGDTTYDISTTTYLTQQHIYNDNLKPRYPDTLLEDLHHYKYTYRNNNYYQHQGNLGTAVYPVFYEPADKIGINYGYKGYDIYGTAPDAIRYYDTKSPYTDVDYLQGINTGEQYVKGEFSRNITPFWNIGTAYQRLSSHKQIGVSQRRDMQARNQDYLVYTAFHTKDHRYHFLGNFKYFLHHVNETGGIRPEFPGQPKNELFDYELENTWLSDAYSRDRRINYHIYHQFRIFKDSSLSVFHEYNRLYQRTRYNDESIHPSFYKNIYKDSSATFYEGNYREERNKGGIKGNIAGFHARLYGRHRRVSFNDQHNFIRFTDQYAGASLKYQHDDSIYAKVTGEALTSFQNHSPEQDSIQKFKGRNDYKASVLLRYKPLQLGYKRVLKSPDIFQLFMDHNLFQWNNDFGPEMADKLYLNYHDQYGMHEFDIRLAMKNVYGHIYLDTNAIPQQLDEGEDLSILSARLQYSTAYKNFHLKTTYRYEKAQGPDVLRFPPMLARAGIFYEYHAANKPRNFFQGGIEARWRHAYNGNAYMPATQHFYLQNDFPLAYYTVLNLYISAHIKDTRLFVRWTHFNQGDQGYFITPYYPGMQRSIQFGVHVQLFN